MELKLEPRKHQQVKKTNIVVSENTANVVRTLAKLRGVPIFSATEYLIMKGLEAEYSEQEGKET